MDEKKNVSRKHKLYETADRVIPTLTDEEFDRLMSGMEMLVLLAGTRRKEA